MTRTIDCEKALRLLAEYLDSELDHASAAEVERHLETCRSCYSRAEFERRLKARLSDVRHAPVGPSLEQGIRSLIRRFGASAGEAGD
jgi:anti-sigma factor (TIGR02949 family)